MRISSGEIHLWFAFDQQIRDPHVLERYSSLLNEEERTRHERFYFEKYLIDESGKLIKRYRSMTKPDSDKIISLI